MQQSIKLTYGHRYVLKNLCGYFRRSGYVVKNSPFSCTSSLNGCTSTLCVVNLASEAYILLLLFVDMVRIYVEQHDFKLAALFSLLFDSRRHLQLVKHINIAAEIQRNPVQRQQHHWKNQSGTHLMF